MEQTVNMGWYYNGDGSIGLIRSVYLEIPMELIGAGTRMRLLYGTAIQGPVDHPVVIDTIERAVELIRFNTPEDLQGKIFAIRYGIDDPSNIKWGSKKVATLLKSTPKLEGVFNEWNEEYDEDCRRYWEEFNIIFNRARERLGINEEEENYDINELYRRTVAEIKPDEFPRPMNPRVDGIDKMLMEIDVSPDVPDE